MRDSSFPYAYWAKVLGLLIMAAGVASFFIQHARRGFFDLNELALGVSWGLVFIFFSKEKTDDEMMRALKFKALARATIVVFFATHLFNYLFLNWHFYRERDRIMSISAYQYLALTLAVATILFYVFKRQASQPAAE